MRVTSSCPFAVLPLVWEPAPNRRGLTVIVKATFRVAPSRAMAVAPWQEPLGGDRFWGDDPRAALFAPSDWVPAKPRAEVMVVGHAYAPRGAPTPTLVARLDVGAWHKSIRIVGDRLWTPGPTGLVPGQPIPFERMPLRDELAFASAGVIEGRRALPNLEATFGPRPPRLRAEGASPALTAWAHRLSGAPPLGFDFAFFNAAPADQQLDTLPRGAKVQLHHLHPELPSVTTYLPQAEPRALLSAPGAEPRAVVLRCDTLRFDTDRAVAVMTYRGFVDLHAQSEAHQLSITYEGRDEIDDEGAVQGTFELSPSAAVALAGRPVMPFASRGTVTDEEAVGTVEVGDLSRKGPALPFRDEGAAAVLARLPPSAPASDEESAAGGTSDIRYGDLLRRQHPFDEPFAQPNAPLQQAPVSAPPPASAPPAPVNPISPQPVPSQPISVQPAKPLTIEGYAAVMAALALKRPLAEALEREGVPHEAWAPGAARHKEALAQGRDVKAYDGAFVAALERLRGPFTAKDYAAIAVGLERGRALDIGARYQLGPADLMRVQRVGALRAAADPALAASVSAEATALRRG